MSAVRERIRGSIPALITPMKDGKVDEAAFRKLVNWQIEQGSHGLVPCGTTGESPTLSHEEHMRVVEICVEEARGRVPVIAGAGSNSTDEAISLSQHAKKVGADAVLSVTGYYNKPSQEGMYRHFAAITDAVDIPILVYNIPARAIVEMSVELMGRLAKLKNIIGVKDATANLARPLRERAACGLDWRLISGEDATTLGYMVQGGHGCISVYGEHCAEDVRRFPERLRAGRVGYRARAARKAHAAARRDVRGAESGAGEVRRFVDRHLHRRSAFAAGGRHRRREGQGA